MNEQEQRAFTELKRLFSREPISHGEQGEIIENLEQLGIIVQGMITISNEWWDWILQGEDEKRD
jgi:hypothetical protein